jgi:hypothetical protein
MSAITEIENSRIKEFNEKLKKFYDDMKKNGKTPIEIENIIINMLEIEDKSEDEYEYQNYGTQPDGSYMVAGGGMMNGNSYATVEKKDGKYYYCEYGKFANRKYIGNTIIWSDERQDDGRGEFNIE